jgi:predicted nucleic acid-binding protein
MDVVVDTDILSTFVKLNNVRLLVRLFPKSRVLLCPAVHKDMKRGFADFSVPTGLHRITLELAEKRLVREMVISRNLGFGDVECMAVAKNRNCMLLTNDAQVVKLANSLSIQHLSLPLLLRALWKNRIVPKERVEALIEEIERKDRIVFRNKSLIFT